VVHRAHLGVQQPASVQFPEDRGDAASPVDVLHEVVLGVRGHLADAGHPAAQRIDVVLGEVDMRLLRGRQ